MKKLTGLFILLIPFIATAQNGYERQVQAIKTFIQGINLQDYDLVKSPLDKIGKIIIFKKKLKDEFAPFHEKYDVLNIDTVICNSVYCKYP